MTNKPFRILSIDGGGLRGIIPVTILQKLEELTGKRVYEMFDLIAGTSTGGIITCACTVKGEDGQPKFTLPQIADLFASKASTIFPKPSGLKKIINSVEKMWKPGYNPSGLQSVLEGYFGDEKITDCLTNIFVTSYDLSNNRALFFKSRQAKVEPMLDTRLIDVCRATSAAPTYFPAYCFSLTDPGNPSENSNRICIDGGVFMNNPEVGAFVEVSKFGDGAPYNRPELTYDDICILSLGTGHYTSVITASQGQTWGELEWAPNISDVMMQGVGQTADYMGEELTADGNHLRIQIVIGEEKYDDMSDSAPETRAYLLQQVQNQVFNNASVMEGLNKFIEAANLRGTPVAV